MSEKNQLVAKVRDNFGKGAARKLRAAGQTPVVVYGHGTDPVHLSLPGHEVQLALRVANAVLELSVDGGKTELALAKQAQRNPIKGNVEHLDLVIVKKGEKVTVEVPLLVVGDHPADRMIVMDQQTISLEVEATHIPERIEIDIAGLGAGDRITVADLTLPEGASYHGAEAADENVILTIAVPKAEAEEAEEGEEGEAAEESEAGEAE